ncbi:MAG: alpha/beta fold hydrolase [Acidimicrobiales bacterium]
MAAVYTPNGSIQVSIAGSGSPLVYLHSATGEGEGTVALDLLAERHTVYAPMFPGFGTSEGIERIDDIEDAIWHIVDVLDALSLDAPDVVGMSLGGWMTAELAARYPARVNRIVLINAAGLWVEGAPIKEIFGRLPDELAEDLFADQSHPMAAIMHEMARLAQDKHAEIPFDLLKPTLQSLAATAKVAWNPYLHDPKLPRLLARVTAPCLVVHGAQDALIPRAHAEAYVALINRARLVDVDGAGHLAALEAPDAVVKVIEEFLAAD